MARYIGILHQKDILVCEFSLRIYELRIARYRQKGYNEFKAQKQTIIDLSKEYGFLFEEVT